MTKRKKKKNLKGSEPEEGKPVKIQHSYGGKTALLKQKGKNVGRIKAEVKTTPAKKGHWTKGSVPKYVEPKKRGKTRVIIKKVPISKENEFSESERESSENI